MTLNIVVLRCRHYDGLFGCEQPNNTLYTLEAVNLTTGKMIQLQTRSGVDGPFILRLPSDQYNWYVDSSTFRFGLPYQILSDEQRRNHVLSEFGTMIGDAFMGELPENLTPSYKNILSAFYECEFDPLHQAIDNL